VRKFGERDPNPVTDCHVGGTVVGAINTYSHDVFDEHAIKVGLLFAAAAGLAVHNAQVLAHAQTHGAQLQAALGSRAS
jgi:hypothetical protein